MTAPQRILHVFGGMNRGGAETMVMNLYRQMDRSAIQFDFAVNTNQECHYDSEIESLGGRILPHPIPAEAGFRAYTQAFARTLKTCGPFAAVHSHIHLFSGAVLQVSQCHGVGVRISHSHSTGRDTRLPLHRQAYGHYMRFLIRRFATHLLGCSRQACESLFGAGCWSDVRVQTVPNAICLADYQDSARSGQLREALQLPAGTPLVGHIGSFTEPKNHAFVIQVFQELSRRLPDAHFLLIGDGVLRSRIEQCIRAAGLHERVHLLGIRSDVPQIMAELDLLLLPSLWEGLPVVLVEAQAAGLPCMVSDTVTPEADLETGVIRFASLRNGADRWAEESLAHLKCTRPSRAEREWALRRAGYDVIAVSRRLAAIYAGSICADRGNA
jgi:glycosyltransferase involved in cell wall biosynthesis